MSMIDDFITAAIQRRMETQDAEIVAAIQAEGDEQYNPPSDPRSVVDLCQAEIGAMFADSALETRVRKCMAGEAPWLAADVIRLSTYYFNENDEVEPPVLVEAALAADVAQSSLNEIPTTRND